MNRKIRLFAAAMSAAALAALGMGSAAADPLTSTIDPTRATSLIIHKYEGPAVSTAGCQPTGQPVPASCLTGKQALSGAEFTLYKVMDLKTNADWEAAKAYYGGTYDVAGKTAAGTVTTGTDGVATFSNGQVALYYVVETKAPTGYTGSVPFFVTLPMTDLANTGWDYDIDVYPKNDKVDQPHKAVLDGNVGTPNQSAPKPGDKLTYQVSTLIPNYGDVVGPVVNGKYTAPDGVYDHNDLQYFVVRDTFSTDLSGITVDKVTVAGTTLVLGTDYTVSTSGQTVTVQFTNAGLDKLTAQAGKTVQVDYVATVATAPADGTLENTAIVVPGPKPSVGSTPGTYTPETPGTPTNEVVSKYGLIQIYKVGMTGPSTEKPLPGATFEIRQAKYADTDGDGKVESDCSAAAIAGNPVLDTFVTGSDGRGVATKQLELSNWYNDNVEKDASGAYLSGGDYATKHGLHDYCLVETQAPEGYQLLAQPIRFSLTSVGTTTVPIASLTKVVNEPDNIGNHLPLTGGEGVALISVAGIALVGGGLAYYGISSRRRNAQN